MINNRQNGRRRGRGGSNTGNGGGGGGNAPRQGGGQGRDNGNRIDNRARGNAAQLLEKYKGLAADAQRQGDRVNTEYYLQFADHYFRVLSEQRSRFEDQQPQQARRQQADSYDEFDQNGDEYGDEGEPVRADEQSMARDDYRGDDARRDNQNRDSQGRDQGRDGQGRESQGRDSQARDEGRDDRSRDDQRGGSRVPVQRSDGQREGARSDGQRNDGQRNEGQRSEGPRREPRGERQSRRDGQPRFEADGNREDRARDDRGREDRLPEAIPAPIGEPHAAMSVEPEVTSASTPVTEVVAEAPVARRRGRPPKVRDDKPQDGVSAEAIDADRLPPSLGVSVAPTPSESTGEDGEPKPRRRRTRAPAAEVEAG